MEIALAGLGRMGGAVATHLARAGHRLRVVDPAEAARRLAAERGYAVFASVAEAASGAEMALLSLPDAPAVEQAVAGERGLLEARPLPAVCVDMTSSLPSVTRRLGDACAARGVALADAPLSGGVKGAAAGTLTTMVGAEAALLEEIEPVLACFSARVLRAGGLGAGHCVKAINNALASTSLASTGELLAVATALGAAPDAVVAAFNAGLGRSRSSEDKFPDDILTGRFGAGFTCGLMAKDVRTACRIASDVGCPAPFAEANAGLWDRAVDRLGPSADFTRVAQLVAERSRPTSGARVDVAALDGALGATAMVAARELMPAGQRSGLDLDRALEIVNASTGRTEATRRYREGLGMDLDEARAALRSALDQAAAAGIEPLLVGTASRLLAGEGAELWP